ncbi:TetR/AcrR family transcriptional regulator [Herpetosiphon sp. NSE202]|uniref:TetR/AcrR family transcriptional regulator n=1 Tax=Herpetosiphon sp. NSE202 TaxID=3351349 RepID=UPI00362777C7
MTKKDPQATKAKLLHATVAVIMADGAANLTLEAVAKAAQVSKGGLLHHFPTKEALFYGLLELGKQAWEACLAAELSKEASDQLGYWHRAYIHASFNQAPEDIQILHAMRRVVSIYPNLFEAWREAYAQPISIPADDRLALGRSLTIQLACDALWFSELIGLPTMPSATQQALYSELLRLTYEH